MKNKVEFVFCVGLQSSASTWLFNIVCEMYRSIGKKTLSFYSDELGDVFKKIDDTCEVCVVKSHSLDQNLIKFIAHCKPKLIISTREIKDAVSSMMNRFDSPFRDVPRDLSKSLCSISCLDLDHALVLRYEDKFFKDPLIFKKISDFLSLDIDWKSPKRISLRLSIGFSELLCCMNGPGPLRLAWTRNRASKSPSTG